MIAGDAATRPAGTGAHDDSGEQDQGRYAHGRPLSPSNRHRRGSAGASPLGDTTRPASSYSLFHSTVFTTFWAFARNPSCLSPGALMAMSTVSPSTFSMNVRNRPPLVLSWMVVPSLSTQNQTG